MRILYDNLVDPLTSGSIIASTEDTSYPAINIQDQRLTTPWKTTAATSQTMVIELPTLPEYPDDPAGVTYFQDAWTPVNWAVVNATESISGGVNTVTPSSSTAGRLDVTIAIPASSTIKIKCRRVASSANTLSLRVFDGSTTTNLYNEAVTGTDWVIFNLTAPATAQTIFRVYCDTTAGTDPIAIDWIYIGTGKYLDNSLLDLSGNANHGTIYGATPVDTPYGRGLSFDGVNDRILILGPSINVSSDFSVSGAFKLSALPSAGNYGVVWKQYNASADRVGMCIDANGVISFGIYTTNYTAVRATAVAVVGTDYLFTCKKSGSTLTITINGVDSNTSTTAIRILASDTGYFTLSSTAGDLFSGIIAQPRIYNRALSATEILNLYNQTPFATENYGLAGYWDVDHGLGINTVAIGGHNIKTGTQVKIQASNTNEWSYPEVNETLTVNPDLIVKFLDEKKFYKYWRFSFGSQGSLEIGRLWLGKYLSISPSSLLDFTVTMKHSDVIIYGRNRQKFGLPGVTWREFKLSFPETAEAMTYQLKLLYNEVGAHKSIIFCNFDTITGYSLIEPCYCSIVGDLEFRHIRGQRYRYSLVLEEDK